MQIKAKSLCQFLKAWGAKGRGAKGRGAKDRGAKDRGAKDRGAKVLSPCRAPALTYLIWHAFSIEYIFPTFDIYTDPRLPQWRRTGFQILVEGSQSMMDNWEEYNNFDSWTGSNCCHVQLTTNDFRRFVFFCKGIMRSDSASKSFVVVCD